MNHRIRHDHRNVWQILIVFILLSLTACQAIKLPQKTILSPERGTIPPKEATEQVQVISQPEALIEFRVQVPEGTPPDDEIYLSVLDEVTGLFLNAKNFKMEVENESTGKQPIYTISLPFPFNSVIKYRYERQSPELRVAEHISNGDPVRYRLYRVDGPGNVTDVISRWTDTEYTAPSGRIMGQAVDESTNQPIPNLLITAGGAQTYSKSDGAFLIEGLPPGIHNLVGYAMDGSYQTFQQGAEIAAESTTPTPIRLNPAPKVLVTFVVQPPDGTPPLVPVRLAGNLYQLGNTFGTLTGGVNTLATRMPELTPQADGSYSLTIQLPVGADIQYKYTLGDGYWNAEHSKDGSFVLRQLIVPDEDTIVQNTIETWHTNSTEFITFDVTVPANTPPDDYVSIQFNPLFGWTESIPMWNLGNNRWAYVLYSPLNLPGSLSYRFCRNNQCGIADDVLTPGKYGKGRSINLDQLPQQLKENVDAWVGLGQSSDATLSPQVLSPRSSEFITGIEILNEYHPSWSARLSDSLKFIKEIGASWIIFDPTWSLTNVNPPVMEPVAGKDPLWLDIVDFVQQAHANGLKVALRPNLAYPQFAPCQEEPCPSAEDAWWLEATRDYSWWLVWFNHYRDYVLHHADLAEKVGADALILGNDALDPALPIGRLPDGSYSQVPSDAEERWRNILADVDNRYHGTLGWSMPRKDGQAVPGFLDAVDFIYLDWNIDPVGTDDGILQTDVLSTQISTILDGEIKNFQSSLSKPLVVALETKSYPELASQEMIYSLMLDAISQREWINGFISQGYYPPVVMQDQSSSIHGKPAESLLGAWFKQLSGNQP